jgi:hypothetical protein
MTFIGWMLGKAGKTLIKNNQVYRAYLAENKAAAFVLWFFTTVFVGTGVSLYTLFFTDSFNLAAHLFLGWTVITTLYVAVNAVSLMYEAYQQERNHLFQILKDSE